MASISCVNQVFVQVKVDGRGRK